MPLNMMKQYACRGKLSKVFRHKVKSGGETLLVLSDKSTSIFYATLRKAD